MSRYMPPPQHRHMQRGAHVVLQVDHVGKTKYRSYARKIGELSQLRVEVLNDERAAAFTDEFLADEFGQASIWEMLSQHRWS